MKIYKVVQEFEGRYLSTNIPQSDHDKPHPYFSDGIHSLEYVIGKTTKPFIPNSLLYAFDTAEHAMAFALESQQKSRKYPVAHPVILECEGKKTKYSNDYIGINEWYNNWIKDGISDGYIWWWKEGVSSCILNPSLAHPSSCFPGAILCSSIKPIAVYEKLPEIAESDAIDTSMFYGSIQNAINILIDDMSQVKSQMPDVSTSRRKAVESMYENAARELKSVAEFFKPKQHSMPIQFWRSEATKKENASSHQHGYG